VVRRFQALECLSSASSARPRGSTRTITSGRRRARRGPLRRRRLPRARSPRPPGVASSSRRFSGSWRASSRRSVSAASASESPRTRSSSCSFAVTTKMVVLTPAGQHQTVEQIRVETKRIADQVRQCLSRPPGATEVNGQDSASSLRSVAPDYTRAERPRVPAGAATRRPSPEPGATLSLAMAHPVKPKSKTHNPPTPRSSRLPLCHSPRSTAPGRRCAAPPLTRGLVPIGCMFSSQIAEISVE